MTSYLNTDCIIASQHDLSELLSEIEDRVFVLLHRFDAQKGSCLEFETNLFDTQSPEQDIVEFLDIFAHLSPTNMMRLKQSQQKVFDIGFESASQGAGIVDYRLDSQLMRLIADYGFAINIRIYPPSRWRLANDRPTQTRDPVLLPRLDEWHNLAAY